MQFELAPLATVVAALIAGSISFVSLTLNKEQKTSEFRQAWIDGLRNDLAAFFAAVRAFARATQEHRHIQESGKPAAPFAFTEEAVSALRHQVAETRYRIQLRLNPKEAAHIELMRLMTSAIEKQQRAMFGQVQADEVLAAVEAAAAFAPQVLKAEWERVKRGELPFRVVRNWVAPIVIVLSIGFVAFLLVQGEKRSPLPISGKPAAGAPVKR